jgi:hypothetical protein
MMFSTSWEIQGKFVSFLGLIWKVRKAVPYHPFFERSSGKEYLVIIVFTGIYKQTIPPTKTGHFLDLIEIAKCFYCYGGRNRFLQYHALRNSKAAPDKHLQQKKFRTPNP